MQVVLLGAAFDPAHLGHLQMTKAVLAQQLADQVWLVPTNQHPFGKTLSSAQHRLAMLKLLIADPVVKDQVKIITYELDQDQPSYSLATLQALAQQYPQHQFSWLIGADNLT
ncbi:MAG: adenylyltransferase/cytidyltransferase family protein, partial [Candidatus Pacebacteria bacterium]|nr:adenylyltransferase/cytidyltransferase family protein [Candidatus Paceibacterota bacterium]